MLLEDSAFSTGRGEDAASGGERNAADVRGGGEPATVPARGVGGATDRPGFVRQHEGELRCLRGRQVIWILGRFEVILHLGRVHVVF